MDILYSDKDIIACIKPVGMDAEHEVPEALKAEFGGEIFTVHRLDLNVGGVMVYARNKQSAAALSKAIQEGTMVKEYIAMVHGEVPEEGDWEDLLWKDSKKNKVFVVNRMRGDLVLNGEIYSDTDIENTLKVPIIGVIPEDDSIIDGVVDAPNSTASKAFKILASNVKKQEEKTFDYLKKYTGFWGSIRRELKKRL
jgi:MinD-like ATPase involved in chromosome partitioning or flagellar assembly